MKLINTLATWSFLALIVGLPFRIGYVFVDFSPLIGGIPNNLVTPAVFLFDIILLASILLSFLASHHVEKDIVKHGTLVKWLILALFFLVSAEAIFSPRGGSSTWYHLLRWAMMTGIAWLAIHHVKHISFLAIFRTFIVAGVLQACIGLGQYIKQSSLGLKYLGESFLLPTLSGVAKIDVEGEKLIRAYGTFGHPNQLGAFLLVACVTAFILLLISNDSKAKIIYAASLAIIILGIFATFSRAVLFVLPFILGFAYLTSKKEGSNRKSALITIILCIFFAVLVFSAPLSTRLTVTDDSTIQRIDQNKRGIEIIEDNPIFGVGLGNTLKYLEENYTYEEYWQIQPPHNYFILLAAEIGLVGLVLIIIIFSILLKALWLRVRQRGDSMDIFLLTIFAAFIFLMFFDHYFYTLPQTQLLLWLVIGLVFGVIRKTPVDTRVINSAKADLKV